LTPLPSGVYVRGDLVLLEAGFAALEQGVTVHDHHGRVVACNPAAARIIGLPVDDILAGPRDQLPDDDDRGNLTRLVRGVLLSGMPETYGVLQLGASGRGPSTALRVSMKLLFGESRDQVMGLVASFGEIEPPIDVGTAKAADVGAFLEVAPEALIVLDEEEMVLLANRTARELAGRAPRLASAIQRNSPLRKILLEHARLAGDDPDDREVRGQQAMTCVFESTGPEELWLVAQLSPAPSVGNDSPRTVCSLRDISDERRREAQLTYEALHDALTGLPNLRLVREHFELALARARRGEQCVGLLFLDVNGLKRVNDEMGHQAGDALLVEFATRLTAAVRASDPVGRVIATESLVGRQGGDEFVVILTDLAHDPNLIMQAVTERLEQALRKPLLHGRQRIHLSAAIGAAAYPRDGADAKSLIEHANAAMRQTKRAESPTGRQR
jgi:diguanylate cyclase (GGDEF)-like protein